MADKVRALSAERERRKGRIVVRELRYRPSVFRCSSVAVLHIEYNGARARARGEKDHRAKSQGGDGAGCSRRLRD